MNNNVSSFVVLRRIFKEEMHARIATRQIRSMSMTAEVMHRYDETEGVYRLLVLDPNDRNLEAIKSYLDNLTLA